MTKFAVKTAAIEFDPNRYGSVINALSVHWTFKYISDSTLIGVYDTLDEARVQLKTTHVHTDICSFNRARANVAYIVQTDYNICEDASFDELPDDLPDLKKAKHYAFMTFESMRDVCEKMSMVEKTLNEFDNDLSHCNEYTKTLLDYLYTDINRMNATGELSAADADRWDKLRDDYEWAL